MPILNELEFSWKPREEDFNLRFRGTKLSQELKLLQAQLLVNDTRGECNHTLVGNATIRSYENRSYYGLSEPFLLRVSRHHLGSVCSKDRRERSQQ